MKPDQSNGSVHRSLSALAALCIWLALSGTAAVGGWWQEHKLTGASPDTNDYFGCSVAVNGDTIVVGVCYDDDASPEELWCNSGSAYIFDAVSGERIRKLIADDAEERMFFGGSVAVNGNIIVIGAVNDGHIADEPGAAYVFDATTGQQMHKLIAVEAEDANMFGGSVSVSGNTIAIGASCDREAGYEAGAAYVFDAVTGERLHKLLPDDVESGDRFGSTIAISGNTIVAGARRDDDAGYDAGAAYVFDATTGEQLHKLIGDSVDANDNFGRCVAMSGGTIVIGAGGDDGTGVNTGTAYVFDAITGDQLHMLTANDATGYINFGDSVDISGSTVVVGANTEIDCGSAYIFDAFTGEQLFKLAADDADLEDYFGGAVAVSSNAIVIGAINDDDACPWEPECNSGAAYVFRRPGDHCTADIAGPDGVADGTVDIFDLLLVLAYWGVAGSDGDIAGPDGVQDGIVDVHDLLALLGGWGPCPEAPCPWDFTGEGTVDDEDAQALMDQAGDCPDPPVDCPWDLTGDSIVDVDDLWIVLDHYGPCP